MDTLFEYKILFSRDIEYTQYAQGNSYLLISFYQPRRIKNTLGLPSIHVGLGGTLLQSSHNGTILVLDRVGGALSWAGNILILVSGPRACLSFLIVIMQLVFGGHKHLKFKIKAEQTNLTLICAHRAE